MTGRLPFAPVCVALCAAGVAAAALAAAPEWTDALSGRLQHIKATQAVRVGYRENAIPFSYVDPEGRPAGYSLDVCAAIATTIAQDLGVASLAIDYVPVTAQDRVAKVVSGAVDLECGSTTNTAERRQQVAFSPVIFVTGTRIAVPRGRAIRDAFDLRGRPVAVVRGTTNEAAMREFDRLHALALRFVGADDYPQALALLDAGRADALAADDVLLRGLLVEKGRSNEFRLVGDLLSFEPYGIMYPKDDAGMADAVDRTLASLAASREIVWIYDRWFVRPLPARGAIGLPMGTQLHRSLELLGLPAD